MSKKTYRDPAGIFPNTAKITLDGQDTNELDSIHELLRANTLQGRLDKFKEEYSPPTKIVNELQSLIDNKENKLIELKAISKAIEAAELTAIIKKTSSKIIRDNNRQQGTRNKRRVKAHLLDEWLEKQNLTLTAEELFLLLPQSDVGDDLYRDGNFKIGNQATITEELGNGAVKKIKKSGFRGRIKKLRKKIKEA